MKLINYQQNLEELEVIKKVKSEFILNARKMLQEWNRREELLEVQTSNQIIVINTIIRILQNHVGLSIHHLELRRLVYEKTRLKVDELYPFIIQARNEDPNVVFCENQRVKYNIEDDRWKSGGYRYSRLTATMKDLEWHFRISVKYLREIRDSLIDVGYQFKCTSSDRYFEIHECELSFFEYAINLLNKTEKSYKEVAIEVVLSGKQREIMLERLRREELPLKWNKNRSGILFEREVEFSSYNELLVQIINGLYRRDARKVNDYLKSPITQSVALLKKTKNLSKKKTKNCIETESGHLLSEEIGEKACKNAIKKIVIDFDINFNEISDFVLVGESKVPVDSGVQEIVREEYVIFQKNESAIHSDSQNDECTSDFVRSESRSNEFNFPNDEEDDLI